MEADFAEGTHAFLAMRICSGSDVFCCHPQSRLYISQYVTANDGSVLDNVSSTRDEKKHSDLRRAVANAYALATLVDYEPLVDSTSFCFFEQMEQRFVISGKECPLSKWVQMYAFDLM
jgi:hypothetical protein